MSVAFTLFPSSMPRKQPSATRRKSANGGAHGPTTAGGKRANMETLERAAAESRQALKQRHDDGHRAAGRLTPSSGTTVISPTKQAPKSTPSPLIRPEVDTAIRDLVPLTEDAKLLQAPGPRDDFTRTDPWRVLRMTSEIIEGFDSLAWIDKGVSIFGSARTAPDDPQYLAAVETARLLGEAGFTIITGAGPSGGAQCRLQHRAAVRTGRESVCRYARELPLLHGPEDHVHQVQQRVHHLSRRFRHA
jgi:hypothetical protein